MRNLLLLLLLALPVGAFCQTPNPPQPSEARDWWGIGAMCLGFLIVLAAVIYRRKTGREED